MRLRDFLNHRIPVREIVSGHHPALRTVYEEGERLGVLVRHGWLHRLPGWRRRFGKLIYYGDWSYPPEDYSKLCSATELKVAAEATSQRIPDDFERLFIVNCRARDPRVTALPVGTYPNHSPWRFLLAGVGTQRSKLVYCNFSMGRRSQPDYRAKRKKVYAVLKEHDWITFENIGNKHGTYDISFLSFYRQVARHRFTISPEGKGIDCHRTWEAMYLKSVPIVQRSPEMQHFVDLPILFTDDYSELSPGYLEEAYQRMLETDYNIEKLYASFWRRQIEKAIEQARRAA